MNILLKKPTAWFPFAMSASALMLVLGYVALFGVQESQEDEGIAARIFQLLLAGQLPVMIAFALTYLPQMPKQAVQILAFQIIAALIPFAFLFYFEM